MQNKNFACGLCRLILMLFLTMVSTAVCSQTAAGSAAQESAAPKDVAKEINIKPKARDKEVSNRIENILKATQWYENPVVKVDDGIVFLKGETKTPEYKQWAENLAQNTQDVVAVVNKIKIVGPASWYFQQIIVELQLQWEQIIRGLPFFAFALFVLAIAWFVARFSASYIRKILHLRKMHPLLSDVMARAFGLLCLLLGLYFVLKILGLTTMALTVLGGTGLLGIILGIAFRDITENLLASILLSIQNPFRNNDLVEIDGIIGYVQALTIRVTILITLEGQQVQVPNATVYKSNIRNFTSNPNRREDFVIGIGYEEAISHAQEVALRILEKHPAVLANPEPWVLVENLAAATVNLRIYFWLDNNQHNCRKVKSSVIRLVKRAFQDEGITIPGNEVALNFLNDISVNLLEQKTKKIPVEKKKYKSDKESESIATDAESDLSNEMEEIQAQARRSRPIDKDENLLK